MTRDYERRNADRVAAAKRTYREANAEAIREYMAAYHAAHGEQLNAVRRADYAANRDQKLARNRAWAEANPDKVKAASRAYYAANRERIKARAAARYAAKGEEIRAKQTQRHQERPELRRVADQKVRAKRAAAPGSHSAADIRALMKLQRGLCVACRCDIRDSFHVDHILALARNGSNERTNLQLLCPTCNRKKHARDPIDFMQSQGFLL